MYIDKLYNRLYSDKDALNVFLHEVKLFAEKEPSFWQRHKGKILGAAALAALAAGAYGGYKYAQSQNDEVNDLVSGINKTTKGALDNIIPEENKVKYTELDKQNHLNTWRNLEAYKLQERQLLSDLEDKYRQIRDEYGKKAEAASPDEKQAIYDECDSKLSELTDRIEKLRHDLHKVGVEQGVLTGEIKKSELDKYYH